MDLTQDRYDRHRGITWWDQKALSKSNVLVVGAGALGNELVKNLSLVGVGNISIVDMDLIEHTNLARCVFFRDGDEGKNKAEVLAKAAHAMNPDVTTHSYSVPVQKLGDGFISDFDMIVAGLDNREARIWLGAATRRLGKFWIDGAIEGLMGKVQTFTPNGSCYACSMTSREWEIVSKRKSCALLGKEEIISGHTPTNATTSSIVAGIQSQEVIKHLVNKIEMSAIQNKVWRFIGDTMDTLMSEVSPDPECIYHDEVTEINEEFELGESLLELSNQLNLSKDGHISFYNEVVLILRCSECDDPPKIGFADLMLGQGQCKTCKADREVTTANRVFIEDEAQSVKITKNFWPLKFLVHVDDKISKTVVVKGDKYVG